MKKGYLNRTAEQRASRRAEKDKVKTADLFGLVVTAFRHNDGWRFHHWCWVTGGQHQFVAKTYKEGLVRVLESICFIPN